MTAIYYLPVSIGQKSGPRVAGFSAHDPGRLKSRGGQDCGSHLGLGILFQVYSLLQ